MEEKVKELLHNEYNRIEKGDISQDKKTELKNNKIDKDTLAWFLLFCELPLFKMELYEIMDTKIAKENKEVVDKAKNKYYEELSSVITKIMNGKL